MNCPLCDGIIKTVPAGVSKRTGKPYKEFQVCSNRECGYKPTDEDGTKNVVASTQKPKTNGDPYVEGKEKNTVLMCKKDLMVALINAYQTTINDTDLKAVFNDLWSEIEK
jgi:hypothetical protein